MKVYLVTEGDYSDYHVIGVYSTQEKANEAKELHMSTNDLEEYEVDHIAEGYVQGMKKYSIVMDRDGNLLESYYYGPVSAAYGRISTATKIHGLNGFNTHMWAESMEHAVKIANERRVRIIAANLWDRMMSADYSTQEQIDEEIALCLKNC